MTPSSLRKAFAFILLCFLLSLSALSAQETMLVGRVFAYTDGAPLENVNVYFKHTDIGTTTNAEGFFLLRTSQDHPSKVVVSAVGYRKVELKMEKGRSASVELQLVEQNTALQDLLVLPGVNPAIALLKQVRQQAKVNNVRNTPLISTQASEKTSLFFSDIDARMFQRRMWRSLQSGALSTEDSTYLMPLYFAKKQYLLQGKDKELLSTADSISTPLSDYDFAALLASLEQNLDFYQNTVVLFGKSFVSPLSPNANNLYRFYITDSITTQRGKQYQVDFKPKNPHNPLFEGILHIDSATYAIQAIDATVPGRNNLNFVKSLQIKQAFSPEANTPFTLHSEHLSVLFDYALPTRNDSLRLFPTLYMHRTTQANSAPHYAAVPLEVPLPSDSAIVTAMGNLTRTPLVRTAQYIVNTLVTRYANLWYVDIGDLRHLISINDVEQVRLGIPLRTSEMLMKNISIGGAAMYGFRDKNWKFNAGIQAKLPIESRHAFALNYQDDYAATEVDDFDYIIRERALGNATVNLPSFLYWLAYQRNTLMRKREFQLTIDNEWTSNFETMLHIRKGWMSYGDISDPALARPYYDLPSYPYHKLSLTGRLSFRERTVDRFFKRIYVRNNLPLILLNAEVGNYHLPTTDQYDYYGKLQLMLHQRFPLGIAGTLDCMLQGGYIFGQVPHHFLYYTQGNAGFMNDYYRFNDMGSTMLASDRYVQLFATWNTGGLLFNQIPWVNRLGLRETASFKMAYGALSPHHEPLLAPTIPLATFTNMPYVEAGVGISNIFGVLGVESIWRLTYRNTSGAPNWQVKFRLEVGQ